MTIYQKKDVRINQPEGKEYWVFTLTLAYLRVHTKHPPPPGTFGLTLIRGGVFIAKWDSDYFFAL